MTTTLRWTVSQSACCFYAADVLRRTGALADAKLAETIAEPVERLQEEIRAAALAEEELWRHLVPLSATVQSNRQLAETALRKTIGVNARVDPIIERLVGRITELEAAVSRAFPKLVKDLAGEAGPLRERWEPTVGPLLQRIGLETDRRLIVPDATVIVVPAVRGGGSAANLLYNSVCIEVLSEDPVAELPEVLRLVWLVSQLNVDLPLFSDNIAAGRQRTIAALAMLPATLAAAKELGLARCDRNMAQAALETWRIDGSSSASTAEVVMQWWTTYVESHPAWNVALAALDRMVPS